MPLLRDESPTACHVDSPGPHSCEHLNQNVVGAIDPSGLYNESMESDADFGGIIRTGAAEPFSDVVKAGFENGPVVYISFYDALRFINWLDNDQPAGEQGAETTEDGWYKAAYFDPVSGTYYEDPVRISMPFEPACVLPSLDTGSAANCNQAVGELTEVSAYAASPRPFSTYDQGGNANEWNETIVETSKRGLRGGHWAPAISTSVHFSGASAPRPWSNCTMDSASRCSFPSRFAR